MIYDCFTFFNELELLELRLHELSGVVDKFVLVEATQTHTNKLKPLHYQENRARFAEFHDKIIHITVDNLPVSKDAWIPENFQRNSISRGLTNCRPDDWVLISDVDEIPRATTLARVAGAEKFQTGFFPNGLHAAFNSRLAQNVLRRKGFRHQLRRHHPFVLKFEQTLYRHFLNCILVKPRFWHGTRMLRFRDFSCAEELRHSGCKIVKNAGWHFAYMGGVERIRQKIAAYAHQEFNQPQFTDPKLVTERIHRGASLFGDDEQLEFVPLDETFPCFVREHPEKFSTWIKPL
jgi:beta-1,4-mannosyl-glycoprotein beta-1,4-N-acetylglucosaminyltransferase